MAHSQARKGAKACKNGPKGRFKKLKGWKANNGAQVGKIRSKGRLERAHRQTRKAAKAGKNRSKGRHE